MGTEKIITCFETLISTIFKRLEIKIKALIFTCYVYQFWLIGGMGEKDSRVVKRVLCWVEYNKHMMDTDGDVTWTCQWFAVVVENGCERREWERKRKCELRGREGDIGPLHGGTRPQISPMDEGPFSPSGHCLRPSHPSAGVPNAALMDPRPFQFTSLSLALTLTLTLSLSLQTFSLLLISILAEETFIVLDKDLVVGQFSHGEPHLEGHCPFLFLIPPVTFFFFFFFYITKF